MIINFVMLPWNLETIVAVLPTHTNSLTSLKPGARGKISGIDATAPSFLRTRLLVLGFTPGVDVEVVRIAPLGDPIEYAVRGTRISLRKIDASLIQIVPTDI